MPSNSVSHVKRRFWQDSVGVCVGEEMVGSELGTWVGNLVGNEDGKFEGRIIGEAEGLLEEHLLMHSYIVVTS